MFYVDSAATPADSQKQSMCFLHHYAHSPRNAASSSGETPHPDIVPNTMEVELSFMPPMDVRSPRRAPVPSHPTSEPPPAKVPSVEEAAPQTTEAPIPDCVCYNPTTPVHFCIQ